MRIVVVLTLAIWAAGTGWAAYRVEPVTDGARIVGRVRLVGDLAPLPSQPVFKEKDYCGQEVTDERLLTDGQGDLANAVVYLVDVEAGKPPPRDVVRMDNRRCAFVPHVLAATTGQTLEMRNEDPFLHDAHAILGVRTLFNRAVPKGTTIHQVLDTPGIAHVNCNVRHTWMHAYLFVADDPYHAVTSSDGTFALDQVPAGTYRIAVWHELLGSQERTVTVGPGQTVTMNFDLRGLATEEH